MERVRLLPRARRGIKRAAKAPAGTIIDDRNKRGRGPKRIRDTSGQFISPAMLKEIERALDPGSSLEFMDEPAAPVLRRRRTARLFPVITIIDPSKGD